MRLHTFQNNLAARNSQATDTHVLRSDLESEAAVYRLAIRPDGIAQIYSNGLLVGTTAGETLAGDAPAQSYLRVGKTVARGEWAVNLYHVAFDASGAFSPQPADPAAAPATDDRGVRRLLATLARKGG
jgi:hypothetical protein